MHDKRKNKKVKTKNVKTKNVKTKNVKKKKKTVISSKFKSRYYVDLRYPPVR